MGIDVVLTYLLDNLVSCDLCVCLLEEFGFFRLVLEDVGRLCRDDH